MHKLNDAPFFAELRSQHEALLARTLDALAGGATGGRAAYAQASWLSRSLGCIALVLRRDDEEALGHFRRAVDYGRLLLSAAPGGGPAPPLVPDASPGSPGEWSRVHVGLLDYTTLLTLAVAFGDVAAIQEVAKFPEEEYSGDPEATPGTLHVVRGWRAWLAARDRDARAAARTALTHCEEEAERAGLRAFQALMAGRARAFRSNVLQRLREHGRQYQLLPEEPDGFVCVQALALCRMAYNEGLQMEEEAYLPLRLLPNYRNGASEYEEPPESGGIWHRALRTLRLEQRQPRTPRAS